MDFCVTLSFIFYTFCLFFKHGKRCNLLPRTYKIYIGFGKTTKLLCSLINLIIMYIVHWYMVHQPHVYIGNLLYYTTTHTKKKTK